MNGIDTRDQKAGITYNAYFDFDVNYNHSYLIHRELFNEKIPIKVDGISGCVIFPGISKQSPDSELPIPIMYFSQEQEVGYITNSYGDFYLKKCLCQFYSVQELDRSFLIKCRSYVERLLSLLEHYKFGFFGKATSDLPHLLEFHIYCDMQKEGDEQSLIFPEDIISYIELSDGIERGLTRKELYVLLGLCSIETLKINLAYELYIDSIFYLHHKSYKSCIINCCGVIEIIMSKQIISKAKENGYKERKTSELLEKKYTGIASLFELAKLMGIKYPDKFDYLDLAKHRNNAAHRGTEPTKETCEKYIKHCREFLNFYKRSIKFYEGTIQ